MTLPLLPTLHVEYSGRPTISNTSIGKPELINVERFRMRVNGHISWWNQPWDKVLRSHKVSYFKYSLLQIK